MKNKNSDNFKKIKPSEFMERYFNVKLYPFQKYIIDNIDKLDKFRRRIK